MEEMLKALLQANAAQRETNRQVAEAVAAQREAQQEMSRQVAAQQAAQQDAAAVQQAAQQEMNRQFAEALLELKKESAPPAPVEAKMIRASYHLQKMTSADDIEAYLATFERVAVREGWLKEQWAGLLAPFLTGEPQKAYFDLEPDKAQDYETLKTEILARLGVTMAIRAQRVHQWSFSSNKPPRSQMFDLVHLTKKWLQPETLTGPQIVERVVMDRYLRALPAALRKWVGQGDPKTAAQLVDLVERYSATEDLVNPSTPHFGVSRGARSPGGSGKTVPGSKSLGRFDKTVVPTHETVLPRPGDWPKKPGRSLEPLRGLGVEHIRCFRCHALGHIAANCPLNDEPMQCDYAYMKRRLSLFAQVACTASCQSRIEKQMCVISVDGKPLTALLDSGSVVTLVRSDCVNPTKLHPSTIGVICIHGDTRDYQTAVVEVETPRGSITHSVGVVPSLLHEALVGRDFPHFWNLWESKGRLVDRAPPAGEARELSPDPFCQREGDAVGGIKEAGDPLPFPVMVGEPEDLEASSQPEGNEQENPSDPDIESSQDVVPDLEVRREDFCTEQLREATLMRARENVKMLDGEPVDPNWVVSFPYMAIKNNLLYRVIKHGEDEVEQLLVPKPFRRVVLDLAHGHVMGGHLGVEKTRERIAQRFFWPGLHADVKEYCESCPECQMSAPSPHFRSPLVPLPIIEVPFERIGMDLVGPVVKSARGHQHILVILDYATRYPEAIPLRNTSAKAIAKELVHVFSRLGIPKEILTDQGTPFMSKVTKELCKLYKISHLRTSVYHPQTDGLVERFNKTLKSMLKKVVDKDGRNWDFLLPYLMFAIREVPQASTGYSPFELLYGRHPRGLLDVAKETWEGEATPYKSIIEHVSLMQDRIAAVLPLVREHMERAQEAQRRVYDRSARVRTFSPGDRVLVLVPTVESKFLAKWQGPFEVVERVGEVNYKVYQPGKRKPHQIYHVNLLKPWKDRETLLATSPPPTDRVPVTPDVPITDTLSVAQQSDVRVFVHKNRDFFSPLPGLTNVIQHDIVTEPGVRVNVKPYRIPEARREAVAKEIKNMLELDVIEESHSEWSSPIVLVPKPDGTIRFCNDFRKLNSVSKFDAYPMPRVDELVDRLGQARYITTLDLTKGYWQIPLSESAKEKTAFSTPEGSFQYKRMPFGLHGAPASFQRMMDKTLRPHRPYAAAYLDDVVIHSPDWESHLPRVQAVVDSLREAGLTANPKKCAIGLEEAKYLGYVIGRGLVKPQTNKIEAIQKWPQPVNKKQVRAFLGITGYYRRFIPDFATIAVPLTDLTKGRGSVMVKWNTEAEKAFQKLKQALCALPVLVTPDFTKEFVVQTDASEVGLGAVLSQVRNGEEHPVVYLSRKLNKHERNYAIVEKECLAIKWALDSLRYYLLGRSFRLVTDHAPLKWMCDNREKNARVTRWFLALQPFKFTVEHRPGKLQDNADALSRVHCMAGSSAQPQGLEQRGRICDGMRGEIYDSRYVSPRIRSIVRD